MTTNEYNNAIICSKPVMINDSFTIIVKSTPNVTYTNFATGEGNNGNGCVDINYIDELNEPEWKVHDCLNEKKYYFVCNA